MCREGKKKVSEKKTLVAYGLWLVVGQGRSMLRRYVGREGNEEDESEEDARGLWLVVRGRKKAQRAAPLRGPARLIIRKRSGDSLSFAGPVRR